MKTGILGVAAATALLALSTTSAKAETIREPEPGSVQVRVINNYTSVVRVYVKDARGRMHDMGWVGHSNLRIVEVPSDISAMGAFTVQVYPADPVWSHWDDGTGIRSRGLTLASDEAVNFWVEPDLTRSKLEIVRN